MKAEIAAIPDVALGPDGKEWAKTEAGYKHVESVMASAVEGPAGLVWYGHIVRAAFVAGAEWQERRASRPQGQMEAAALIAEQRGKEIGEPAIGEHIAKAIRAALKGEPNV